MSHDIHLMQLEVVRGSLDVRGHPARNIYIQCPVILGCLATDDIWTSQIVGRVEFLKWLNELKDPNPRVWSERYGR